MYSGHTNFISEGALEVQLSLTRTSLLVLGSLSFMIYFSTMTTPNKQSEYNRPLAQTDNMV